MIGVGKDFPDFNYLEGVNPSNEIVSIDMYSQMSTSDWKVVYFYPKDFTFICPTEISQMDILTEHASVIGISGDNEFCKLAWKQSNPMIENINHILAADCGLDLANELGIVQDGVCLRATYIVDTSGTIQHVSVNALDTGRNAHEILRTLKALQAGGLTGCNWQEGEDFVA
jgi:peroxiredoxin (alkyl hydroperoxide reductase subunit C)